jgi:hypothetical protein
MRLTDRTGLKDADKRLCADTLVRAVVADYDNASTIVGLMEISCELEARGIDGDEAALEAAIALQRAYRIKIGSMTSRLWDAYHAAFQSLGITFEELCDLTEAAYTDMADTDAYQGAALPSQLEHRAE